jgi:hypothetical protein
MKYILIAMLGSSSVTATFDSENGCENAKLEIVRMAEMQLADEMRVQEDEWAQRNAFSRLDEDIARILCVPANVSDTELSEKRAILREQRAKNDQ